jgi:hypothetical protein
MADRGDARLLAAIDHAEEAGDLLAWIDAVGARYARQSERGAAPAELAALRSALAERADGLRAGMRSRVGRLWAGEVVDVAFGELLRELLAEPDADPAEVFRLVELVKARTLLDLIDGRLQAPPPESAAHLAATEQGLLRFGADRQQDLVFAEMRLASELALGHGAPGRRSRATLSGTEEEYAAAGAGFSGVATPPSLERVIEALARGELLVEYVIPHHPLHPAFAVAILAIHRGGARLLPAPVDELPTDGFIGRMTVDDQAPIDMSPLGSASITLRAAIQSGDDAAALPLLRRLHDCLIEPLVGAGLDPAGFERVTIVPHRLLHPLPWAALMSADGRRLVERAALVFAPSAAVWLALRERAGPLSPSCLALANPPLAYAGADALPNAEDEVRQVAAALARAGVTTEQLVGLKASETALVERAAGHGILYLATHGAFPENDALDFHRLLLARTRRADGIVPADTIRALELRAAWLVVLSICDGGLYRFGPGDEPQGLLPAFLAAGAQNVIATLWQIDDAAGRDLMARAAPHLIAHGPAEALRRAACDALDDPSVPVRDWAGFVVAGTGGPAQIPGSRTLAPGSPNSA